MKNINQTLLLVVIFIFGTLNFKAQSLEDAKRLTESEQYELATETFKLLVSRMPQNGDYWFYFGENYYKSEALDSALIMYQKGVNSDEKNPLNFVGIGKIALEKNDIAEADINFNKAKTFSKKNAEVYIRMAEAYILAPKKNLPKAFELLREAEKLDPKNAEIQILNGDAFLENNDGSSAIQYYEKAQQLDPQSPQALLRIGQLWTRARNYVGRDGQKGALDYYKEAIAIDPGFAPAYRELGELYAKAQRYEDAKENYRTYLDLSKKNLSAKVRYASFLYLTKDYTDAINQINEIFKVDTTKNILNRIAGYAYYETKQYEKGIASMERFFRNSKPEKIAASDYAYYGKLLLETDQDSLGIEQLTIAYEKDPENADLLTDLATVYTKLKMYDDAVRIYNQKIEIKKATVNDYFRLGQSYYNIKEFGKADTAFMKVTEVQPNLPIGYFWRARANSALDPESTQGFAKPHYEALIELTKDDTVKYKKELIEAYSYLGYYYYLTKEYASSRDYWTKVQELDEENNQAKEALTDLRNKVKG